MIQTALVSALLASNLAFNQASSDYAQEKPAVSASAQLRFEAQSQSELGSASMSLNNRWGYDNPNNPYKENILLNLAYMSGQVKSKNDINWDNLRKPFTMQFSLEPGQRFDYHDTQLAQYADNVVLTTHSTFSAQEGYRYSEGLYGMGVCHLASLINMAAKKAGLESIAPTNHDFYAIPEIPREYGVAIFFSPDSPLASAQQNLYIKNNQDTKVTFKFDFDGDNLKVSILK